MALTQLGHLTKAESNLHKAYEMALESHSPSTVNVCEAILQAKRSRWQQEEKIRQEHEAPLLAETIELFNQKYDKILQDLASSGLSAEELQDEREYYQNEKNQKISELTTALARQNPTKYQPRPCPEYLLDPISFNIFVDPVITPSGQSFERAWILEHLRKSKTDPFSRRPLTEKDLVPNLALKQAAEVCYS